MEGFEIKDFTSTTFGLMTAYFLPGVAGLLVLSLYWPSLGVMLQGVIDAEAHAGVILFLLVASLLVGVLVNGVFSLTIHLICSKVKDMREEYFAKLGPDRLACFIAAVDEYYRTHQFYGGMAVVLALLYFGLGKHVGWNSAPAWLALLVFVLLAVESWNRWNTYVDIGTEILGVGPFIKSIRPNHKQAHTTFTLAVTGERFHQGSSVCWNGNAKHTTFVSAHELRTEITVADTSAAGDAAVSVIEGGRSNSVTFHITA